MIQTNTKERILSAALELFSAGGYDAVSVEQIASAVGIKAPSLYKHYKSKKDIFDSIVEKMAVLDGEFASKHGMPLESADDDDYNDLPLDRFGAFCREMFSHWTKDEYACRFRRVLTIEQYRNAETARLYKQYLGSGPLRYTADILRSYAETDKQAISLAMSIYGAMFLSFTVYDSGEKKQAEKQIFDFIDQFISDLKENKK